MGLRSLLFKKLPVFTGSFFIRFFFILPAHTFVQQMKFVQAELRLTCCTYFKGNTVVMQELHIPHCILSDNFNTAKQQLLAANDFALAEQPWPAFKSDVFVQFSIAHSDTAIALLFRVKEKAIRHVNTEINQSVWEDSCVEFFIAFDDAGYYNCEFNCIGTALVGYGSGRTNRELLPADVIRNISSNRSMKKEEDGYVWELLLQIPVTVFTKHTVTSLANKTAKVNFYKCGDLLPEPHFICWNKVETTDPDFHQPDFFVPVVFDEVKATASFKETVHG